MTKSKPMGSIACVQYGKRDSRDELVGLLTRCGRFCATAHAPGLRPQGLPTRRGVAFRRGAQPLCASYGHRSRQGALVVGHQRAALS